MITWSPSLTCNRQPEWVFLTRHSCHSFFRLSIREALFEVTGVNLGLWARRHLVNCFKAVLLCLFLIMGLFAFNKKNQTQPLYFVKLVSKWCFWAWELSSNLYSNKWPVATGDTWKQVLYRETFLLQRLMIFTWDLIHQLQREWQALPN